MDLRGRAGARPAATRVAALTCSVAGPNPPWRDDLERFAAVGTA
ncbi:hypothetical protein ABZT06_30305 [Streptomyces sp. NPDC005483]